MRAIAIREYGGPEVLELMDLPDPTVGPDVVVVRAKAAGVNPADFKIRKGRMDTRYPCHFPLRSSSRSTETLTWFRVGPAGPRRRGG